jgi:hypothetical protein
MNRTEEEWRAACSGRLVELGQADEAPPRNPFARPGRTIFRPRVY